jgi:hypothetical protein
MASLRSQIRYCKSGMPTGRVPYSLPLKKPHRKNSTAEGMGRWAGRLNVTVARSCIGIERMLLCCINLLKPTGHVMHHQFNIEQLYALPTLYLCVLYLSQNKQPLVPLRA